MCGTKDVNHGQGCVLDVCNNSAIEIAGETPSHDLKDCKRKVLKDPCRTSEHELEK